MSTTTATATEATHTVEEVYQDVYVAIFRLRAFDGSIRYHFDTCADLDRLDLSALETWERASITLPVKEVQGFLEWLLKRLPEPTAGSWSYVNQRLRAHRLSLIHSIARVSRLEES